MRIFRVLFIFLIVIGIGTYFLVDNYQFNNNNDKAISDLPKLKSDQSTKEVNSIIKSEIFSLMDKTREEVISELGEPVRKDLTPYGYTWWIYQSESSYIQVGLDENTVQTVYATGTEVNSEPFLIGTSYDNIKEQFPLKHKVTYQSGLSFYSFLLDDTDVKLYPLIKLSDNMFIQCYFDSFTDKLSSIRILTGDILLKQRFYEIEYRGSLPDIRSLSEDEWEQIDRGMEEQIFELTNMLRNKHDLPSLELDSQIREVAYLHSKDMYEQQYFSHQSLDGKGLKERMEEKNVYYLSAGENIAAQHLDAPAAVEGWLNSKGHRETLLSDQYTHLGVGVYRLYYTQNFLLKY